MESVYPTVDIKLLTEQYKILGLTINPLFKVERENVLGLIGRYSGLSHFLPPKNKYQVWIELVLGHDSEKALNFPQIKFSFNAAFKSNNSDRLYQGEIMHSGYPFCNGQNFEIYKHFWLNTNEEDSLKRAYGAGTERIIPNGYCNSAPIFADIKEEFGWPNDVQSGDARFALAFTRSSYRLTPSEIALEVKTKPRLNYPCTFQIISESPESEERAATTNDVILQPRPYELDTWSPSTNKQELKKNESISFWFYYSYGEQTAQHADAPEHDMFSFIHNVTLDDKDFENNIDTNCFPRFPHRFDVHHSEPRLIVSPRLTEDPRPWQCPLFAMYPMTTGEKVMLKNKEPRDLPQGIKSKSYKIFRHQKREDQPKEIEKPTLSFFFGIRDQRTLMERNVGVVIYSLILGVLLNFIASIAMGEKKPVFMDMVLLWILGVISGIFVYLILSVLMGRVDGAIKFFQTWETNSTQSNSNADSIWLVTACIVWVGIIAMWFFSESESIGHFLMVILVASLIVTGTTAFGLWASSLVKRCLA